MKRKIGDYELLPYSLALLAMLMVAFPNLLLIGIICIVIALINVYRAKGLQFRFSWLNSFFVLFYLAYLVGVIYTSNEEWAYRYLEYKLSFIIFPILFSFIQGNKKELIRIPILGLILGVCIVIIIGVFNAFDCYYAGGQFCFYSTGISPVHHPTYFSVYMLFGSVAIWYGFINKWNSYKLYWIIPFTAVAILFHYLCLSLAGILFSVKLLIIEIVSSSLFKQINLPKINI